MSRSTAAPVDVMPEGQAGGVIERPVLPAQGSRPAASLHSGYLFHPITDFLLAGGGSLLVAVPVFWLIGDKASAHPTAVGLSAALAFVINYPHFAHSYQLLYEGIGKRISGTETTQKVRMKYLWAGFVAPLLIFGFLVAAYLSGSIRMLGFVANAYFFTGGWHYVKQGYGVITVLSAVRRIYHSNLEKKLLLLNGYTVWIYSWMAFNVALRREDTLFGVKYYTLDIPQAAVTAGWWTVVGTSVALAAAFVHRVFVRRQPVSWNGIVGYVSSLYLWVIAFYANPVFVLFVPAFHSLQYLLFVWRYQMNKAVSEAAARVDGSSGAPRRAAKARVARFVVAGIVLGFLGFVGAPMALQASLSPDATLWGPTLFLFIFTAGINVHHYFIDNVIWRRDNEDVRRFLFAPR